MVKIGTSLFSSCSSYTASHLYVSHHSDDRSLRCGCPPLPHTWLLMNSTAVLLLETKLKGWMWCQSPHALPVQTPQLRASVLLHLQRCEIKASLVPYFTEPQGPEQSDGLALCLCAMVELVQSGAEGSLSDLYRHSKWTWYIQRLVVFKEKDIHLHRRQSVLNQRSIEKLTHYIRQTNASHRADKKTVCYQLWTGRQWISNGASSCTTIFNLPNTICPSQLSSLASDCVYVVLLLFFDSFCLCDVVVVRTIWTDPLFINFLFLELC